MYLSGNVSWHKIGICDHQHRKTPAWIRHRDVRVNTPYLQVRGTADVRVGPVENGTYSSVKISLWRETEAETTNRTTGPRYYWCHTDFYGVSTD